MLGPMAHAIPTVETERLILHEWRPEDVDAYARICADPQVMRYLWPPRAASPAESAYGVEQMREHWHHHGFGHWAVEERETGRFVGRTGIKHHPEWELDPDNAEVGWLYDPTVWGRGYAPEAARAAMRFLREEIGHEGEIISITHPENTASMRVMEKVGLAYAGRRFWEGKGIEIVWYAGTAPA
jgi:RimJ/RimL family protein N-acetyltransferase